MDLNPLIEEKLRQAIAAGEFDHLPGKGAPLDMEAYFAPPEEWRMGTAILRNAGVLPEEVQLLKEIEELRAAEAAADGEDDRRALRGRRQEKAVQLDLMLARRRRARGLR